MVSINPHFPSPRSRRPARITPGWDGSRSPGSRAGKEHLPGAVDVGGAEEFQPVGGWRKRAVDFAIALVAMAVLSPLMLLIAVLIRATMGGQIIFAHPRIGYNGREFRCLKFRTMVSDPDEKLQQFLASDADAAQEWRETQKLKKDPRVTYLGRALRISSLDELPQLVNVLRGEMSCVGPRPIVAGEIERYGGYAREYLRARPGLTGLWQVSGRTRLSYAERVALDVKYVRNWSMWLDLTVLLKTIPAVLTFQDAA